MDSDSENEILTNNVFTFQTMNTTVCAKGPNMTKSLSFRNHIPSSSMHIPRNMEHSRYASSVYDHRSVYSRREVSPMSVRSAYDFQPRNFNISHYPRGMSSQRSLMNGRSGSPMSITSTTTVSAVDIVMALKTAKFNQNDLKKISDACKKFMKSKIRKKFEKRRNLRLFLKRARHRSGGESGEQGSDSSISDVDCRSNRTSTFKGNMSSCRSTRTDFSSIKRTLQESDMYNDCSANFKQKSFKNMFSIDSQSLNSNMTNKPQNVPLQKDRFKSGFLLPSQRFNKSVAASTIPENVEKQQKNIHQTQSTKENFCNDDKRPKNFMSATDSEHDEIFPESGVRQNETVLEAQRKRSLERDEETHVPHKKKNKLSPIKNIADDILNHNKHCDDNDKNKDNFVFAKPSFPVKKIALLKVKEKLIAKSPHVNNIFDKNQVQELNHEPIVQNIKLVPEKEQNKSRELETTKHSTTDVSMRPSFIKRKLFTQKLDVAENKILSSDNENSPKTVYGGIQKEKNKARKLVTNQSCLSRDVLQDDNYLDLIHKIVPPDQINSTTTLPNKSDTHKRSIDSDTWDVTSVMSTCNNDNVSDTYTDEDLSVMSLNNNNKTKNRGIKDKKSTADVDVIKMNQNCKVVLDRIPTLINMQQTNKTNNNPKQKIASKTANFNKSNMQTCAKSFWDTDLESDLECHNTLKRNNTPKKPQSSGNHIRTIGQQAKNTEPKQTSALAADISVLNNTTASVNKFNNTSIRIRSHRVTKKKKCCEDINQTNSSLSQTQNKNPKSKDLSCLSYTAFVNNVNTNNATMAIPDNVRKTAPAKHSSHTPKHNTKNTTIESKKVNISIEVNRSLRSRKVDLSCSSVDDKTIAKSKSNKQNANNSKQSNVRNNKPKEKTNSTVKSRKSDVSFSLNSNVKDLKSKKAETKKDTATSSKERKPRQSNISFSITSEPPMTRTRAAANKSSEEKEKRTNTKNTENKNISAIMKTPNKRKGKNGVISLVQDLKISKSKSVRKR